MTKHGPTSLLGLTHTRILDEVGVVMAVLLTVTGIALQVYGARHRMAVEERVKDSQMTEAEARRQIRFLGYSAPVVTLIGALLLIVAIFEMAG